MTAIAIGISVGVPSDGIGVTVLRDGEVVEAVTVVPDCGPRSAGQAATRAVRTAIEIVRDTGATGDRLVWIIEDLPGDRPPESRSQPQRASTARGRVRAAQRLQAAMHGGIFAAIDAIAPLDQVYLAANVGQVEKSACPACLSDSKPEGWRGERGLRRDRQRAAYTVASPFSVCPDNPEAYPRALARIIRALGPDLADIDTAAVIALDVITRPTGTPAVTTAELAAWAIKNDLVRAQHEAERSA